MVSRTHSLVRVLGTYSLLSPTWRAGGDRRPMSLLLSNSCPLSRAVHSFSDSFLPGVHKSGGVRGDLHNPARDRVLRHFMETHKMKTANPFISKIKPKKFKKFKKVDI